MDHNGGTANSAEIAGRYVSAMRVVSATAAAGAGLVAAVASAGRLSGAVAHVSGRRVAAVTILALLLGVASYASAHGVRTRAARLLGRALAFAMLAVVPLAVVGGATGRLPGPDSPFGGRMAPNTALGLFFVGLGLLLYPPADRHPHRRRDRGGDRRGDR